jgi:LPS O-antigen subunit length determinant protein (WzzB/FepE family)
MSQNNQPSSLPLKKGDEVSFFDILVFLRRSWKIIVVLGAMGLAIAVIYILITPKQYQAIAQIQMAQIIAVNSSMSPLGINIEEPSMLIARLSFPTSFPSATITACSLDEKKDAASILAKSIKLSQPKGVPNILELKTIASNPEHARECANAIFELVKTSQDKIVSPYIVEAKIKLADDQEQLAKAKDLLLKADKSGSVMGAVYLSTRDEIRHLLDEIKVLRNVVASNVIGVTRLVAPIYVGDEPISPKKPVILYFGLLGGLLLGLLTAFLGQAIPRLIKQPAKK